MLRRILSLLTIAALAAGGFIALQSTSLLGLNKAEAADASAFRPGNLISDENFYNGNAMDHHQIYAFLSEFVAPGTGSSNALVNYVQSTPSMPANGYCDAYQGVPWGENASQIIDKVGKACHISQKALLVLLQKEQSLVSDAWPSNRQLTAATGFGCPDTAPCDSSYGGFFYQVYNAGRQIQYYKANPYEFNHIPFQTNNVLYNPDSSCSSSPVYIENYATAALYNYTPYQPNQAALNNLYGEGDGCSAYGNRNFWRMYTDWFGDPHGAPAEQEPNADLIKGDQSDDIFLYAGGTRYYIPANLADDLTKLGKPQVLPQTKVNSLPWGYWVSNVVTNDRQQPRFISNNGTWALAHCQMAEDYGTPCNKAAHMQDSQLNKLDQKGILTSFVKQPNGLIYLVQSGTKREVPSLDQLKGMGFDTTTTTLPDGTLDYLPTGDPVAGWGVITTDLNQKANRAVLDGYQTHPLGGGAAKFSYFASTATMTSESLGKFDQGDTVTGLVSTGDKSYILTDKGLAEVDPKAYGATPAAKVRTSFVNNLPSAKPITGAHLIKGDGRTEVVLVDNGTRTVFPNAEAAQQEATKRGVSTAITVTTTALVDSIPTATAKPTPTATATPTATPTPTTTAMPSATPTATPSAAPSATATAKPSATPAATGTSTAKPSAPASTAPSAQAVEQLAEGEVITNEDGTGTWIVDGDRLLQIATPAVAQDLGLELSAPRTVNDATFASFKGRFEPLYTSAVRCDGKTFVGLDGELVPFANTTIEQAYKLNHVDISNALCDKLVISTTRSIDTTRVESASGKIYEAVNGQLRELLNDEPLAAHEGDASAAPTATATATAAATATATPTASATPSLSASPAPTAPAEPAPADPATPKAIRLPAAITSIMPKTSTTTTN